VKAHAQASPEPASHLGNVCFSSSAIVGGTMWSLVPLLVAHRKGGAA